MQMRPFTYQIWNKSLYMATSYKAWHQLTWTFHCHNSANLLNKVTLPWTSSDHPYSTLNFQSMHKSLALSIIQKLHWHHLVWNYLRMSLPLTVAPFNRMQSRVYLWGLQCNIAADLKYPSPQMAGSVFITPLDRSLVVSSSYPSHPRMNFFAASSMTCVLNFNCLWKNISFQLQKTPAWP